MQEAYAVVRYDAYLSKHEVGMDMLVRVLRVYMGEDQANAEADRLNALPEATGKQYWVAPTKLV